LPRDGAKENHAQHPRTMKRRSAVAQRLADSFIADERAQRCARRQQRIHASEPARNTRSRIECCKKRLTRGIAIRIIARLPLLDSSGSAAVL
jgi:hypothetical protein